MREQPYTIPLLAQQATLPTPPDDALLLTLLETQKLKPRPMMVITADYMDAQRYPELMKQLSGGTVDASYFPSWETLAYDHFSPHGDLTCERLKLLSEAKTMQAGCLFVSASTLLYRLPPQKALAVSNLVFRDGQTIDLAALKKSLIEAGYSLVNTVYEHGEFASRGSVLDLFPAGSQHPLRLDFFDNEIDAIRLFDPETQCSHKTIHEFSIGQAHEFPLTSESIAQFRGRWRAQFGGNPMDAPMYQNISAGNACPGAEYYLPLFYEQLESLLDYIPNETEIVFSAQAQDAYKNAWDALLRRYENLRHDQQRPLCEPAKIALSSEALESALSPFPTTFFESAQSDDYADLPDLRVNHRATDPVQKLRHFIDSREDMITAICAQSKGRQTVLHDLFSEHRLSTTPLNDFSELEHSKLSSIVCVALENGFIDRKNNIAYISEQDLFGERFAPALTEKSAKNAIDTAAIIRDLVELRVGDPVVHRQHGVAFYMGLESITNDGIAAEYLTLHYANEDKLYVPVTTLSCISRYLGADGDNTPLSRLGSKAWEQATDKAKRKIKDVAAELLVSYSKRANTSGFAFDPLSPLFTQFRQEFPFTETPDQQKTIDAILSDMQSNQPMDRLVCGDVGFGKTEVAMQAAFFATQSHKQVAILAPTTLLASQHFSNFQDRFAQWPIKISLCTRAVTGKALASLKTGLSSGAIDIVIGTHKLLNPELCFKDLGLLIVDEEHRFGVTQKEKIKALKHNIDILTMTATPIPRTLNLSLTSVRDLSIIATPPARRLSIKTFVRPYEQALIKEAIEREITRGGQVYFLHNNIQTMPAMKESLERLIPSLTTVIAHGQMPESQLEGIMSRFYHHEFQVLITTTIIESGIDVTNANTILINNADKFGLAQLHQIRGRVGRSHHQAYAYLLTDRHKKLRPDAYKRLQALEKLTDLGAGFALAMQDLEIRGAGELLGDDQSGHIQKIGFSLYLELLNETIQSLQGDKTPAQTGADIDLGVPTLLTDKYVHDVSERLTLYKRLSESKNEDEITQLKAELIDRFGPLNEEANNLIAMAKLALLANKLGIKKIRAGREYGAITMSEKPNINQRKLIRLIQLQPKMYQLHKQNQLRYKLDDSNRITQCQDLLSSLMPET